MPPIPSVNLKNQLYSSRATTSCAISLLDEQIKEKNIDKNISYSYLYFLNNWVAVSQYNSTSIHGVIVKVFMLSMHHFGAINAPLRCHQYILLCSTIYIPRPENAEIKNHKIGTWNVLFQSTKLCRLHEYTGSSWNKHRQMAIFIFRAGGKHPLKRNHPAWFSDYTSLLMYKMSSFSRCIFPLSLLLLTGVRSGWPRWKNKFYFSLL